MHFFINLDLDKYYSYISFGKSSSVCSDSFWIFPLKRTLINHIELKKGPLSIEERDT